MSSRWYIDKIRGVRSSVPECSTSVGIGAYATSPRLRGTKQTDPPRPKGRSSSKGHTITRLLLLLLLFGSAIVLSLSLYFATFYTRVLSVRTSISIYFDAVSYFRSIYTSTPLVFEYCVTAAAAANNISLFI